MADLKLNVVIGGVAQSVSTLGEVEQALRDTRAELEGVAIGSQVFQELTAQARSLQNELEKVEKSINFEQNINLLGESVGRLGQSVAAGFAVITSAFSLFGNESEELTEAQIKAQQTLNLVLGAAQLATNLSRLGQDLKNISDAFSLKLTKDKTKATITNTTVTAANAAAQETNAAATTGAAVATRGFTAALAANPIGAVLVGVGLLATALFAFSGETEDATEETDRFSESLEKLDQETNDYIGTLREEYRVKIELAKLRGEEAKAAALTEEELQKEVDVQKNKLDTITKDLKGYLEGREDLLDSYLQPAKNNLTDFNIAVADATRVNLNLQNLEYADFYNRQLEQDKKAYEERKEALLNNTAEVVRILKGQLARDPENKELKALIDSYKATSNEVTKLGNDLTLEQERERQRRIENAKRERERLKKELEDITSDNLEALQKIKEDTEANEIELRNLQIESGDLIIQDKERVLGIKEALLKVEFDDEKKVIEDILAARIAENEASKVLSTEQKETFKKNFEEAAAAEIASLELVFNAKREVAKKEDDQVVLEAQERADKLKEINRILQEEIRFGDQDTLDTYAGLQVRKDELEAQALLSESNRQDISLVEYESFLRRREEKLKDSIRGRQEIEIANIEAENKRNLTAFAQQLENEFELQTDFDTRVLQQVLDFTDKQAEIERDALLARQETLTDEERAYLALLQTKLNQTKESEIAINEIIQKYADERIDIENDANDKILTKRLEVVNNIFGALQEATDALRNDVTAPYLDSLNVLQQGITDFLAIQDQEFATGIEKIAAYAGAALGVVQGILSAISDANATALQNDLTEFERVKNEETDILTRQLNQGLITREQYDKAVDKLDKDLQKKSLAAKKKAFEEDKNLKIAQAIIAGLQGAVSAFAGAMQLGPIAGPIVGGVLAAAVAALTGVQIAAIKSTKFDAGGTTESINPPDIQDPGSQLQQQAGSGGGFTQFNEALTGAGGGGGSTTTTGGMTDTRVYVLESDITNTQRRVEIAESTATFG